MTCHFDLKGLKECILMTEATLCPGVIEHAHSTRLLLRALWLQDGGLSQAREDFRLLVYPTILELTEIAMLSQYSIPKKSPPKKFFFANKPPPSNKPHWGHNCRILSYFNNSPTGQKPFCIFSNYFIEKIVKWILTREIYCQD